MRLFFATPRALPRLICLLVGLLASVLQGQTWRIDSVKDKGAFTLSEGGSSTTLLIDPSDHAVVRIAAGLFAEDVGRVSGKTPRLLADPGAAQGELILAGTLGRHALIDRLILEKRLEVSGLQGTWEGFQLCLVDNPLPGVPRALVIVGSDRRGTAYGLLTLSEAMGVSPWTWWADLPPEPRTALYLHLPKPFRDAPAVKYRGLFLNDERFGGLALWAAKKMDPELQNMGPKTYAKVFELLLRLRANYCWPAMHPGTRAFNAIPENRKVADEHAIVMGSSHCEIMLRNNEDEWKAVGTYGPYNYLTNRETMLRYWKERLKTNGAFENTYTLGLRGIHDSAMEGANSPAERLALTQQAIDDQRGLLARHVNPDLTQVPQVLCAYKEVLAIYQGGLRLAPEVTLLWADDNHGYLRQLSTPEEQTRPGRSGVYYHLSYYGDPESYLWLSSLSPSLIASELGKAYAYGADRIWVFNVGDIKPAEKEFGFAMAMAWNPKAFGPEQSAAYTKKWAEQTFGREPASEIAAVLAEYYRLAAGGKPEQTWMIRYSLADIAARVHSYRSLANRVKTLAEKIPVRLRDAYFQLVLYPVAGAARLNELHLLSRRSLLRAEVGDNTALDDIKVAKEAIAELNQLTTRYTQEIAGGKWDTIIDWQAGRRKGFTSGDRSPMATPEQLAAAKTSPNPVTLRPSSAKVLEPLKLTEAGLLNAAETSCTEQTGGEARFSWKSERSGTVGIWFLATTPVRRSRFEPEHNRFWFLSANGVKSIASVLPLGNIWHATAIGPQWSRVGECQVRLGENELILSQMEPGAVLHAIHLGLTPPAPEAPLLRVRPEAFVSNHNPASAKLQRWPGLGPEGLALGITPFDAPSLSADQAAEAVSLDYELTLPNKARELEIRCLPTQRIHQGRGVRFLVSLNGAPPSQMDLQADEFSPEWQQNVLRGYASRKVSVAAFAGAKLRVRIQFLDPGVFLSSLAVY